MDQIHHFDFSPVYRAQSARALDTALEGVPAYAAWRRCDPGSGRPVDERYRAMPVLTKREMREHLWRGFVAADRDPDRALAAGEIELVQTSGTTEERVVNVWHQPWWDASERCSWTYNAHAARLSLGSHPEAILTSPMNTGVNGNGHAIPFVKRRLGRFLYLNEFVTPEEWQEEHLLRMLAELESFQPAVLEANPSYLARLARFAAARNIQPYQPGLIVFTYENPGPMMRRDIARVFASPLMSSYGTTEAGYVLTECEHGRLHQNSECCRLDFQPLRPEHGGVSMGRIFVTTFDNPWRSLLRFDAGDLVELDLAGPCPCGRNGGLRCKRVLGRTANLTFGMDGRAHTTAEIETALMSIDGLTGFQIRQETSSRWCVDATGEHATKIKDAVTGQLHAVYGSGGEFRVRVVDSIPAEASGKYRLTRASFDVDVNALFDPETMP